LEVRIASGVLDAVIAHARDVAPAECCGLLLGSPDSIVESARTRNIAADPASRFLIDPKDHIDGRREARRRSLEVVGFYHSHPRSPAAPSARDRAEAGYPDDLYLIVSLLAEPPEILVFRNFMPVSFVTVR
jgi:proteasome lid subunit RPN8/RPN11